MFTPPPKDLSEEQQTELNDLYWNSSTLCVKIARRFGRQTAWPHVQHHVQPIAAENACGRCASRETVWVNRTSRQKEQASCLACGHVTASTECRCEPCAADRETARVAQERIDQRQREAEQRQREADEAIRLAEFEAWRDRWENVDHVNWAVKKLTDNCSIFLHGLWENRDGGMASDVARRSGIKDHLVEGYLAKLAGVELLYWVSPRTFHLNSAIGAAAPLIGPRN